MESHIYIYKHLKDRGVDTKTILKWNLTKLGRGIVI